MSEIPSSGKRKKENVRGAASIGELMADLRSKDGSVRERARRTLVARGLEAIPSLLIALRDRTAQTRWEAAKALVSIPHADAAPALVEALEDKNGDVRWVAAEALIALGEAAVPPLLRALVANSGSVWLREGAHHVFHDLSERRIGPLIAPVLKALGNFEPMEEVALVAARALERL